MPTVAELTAAYGNVLLAPQAGPGVCETCFNLTNGYERCYACAHGGRWLDAVVPISYSVGGEQLHHALVAYKRTLEPVATHFTVQLAAVLWRFLGAHERCVARTLGVPAFPVVTTVPSNDTGRDEAHPLHRLVGQLVKPTRARFRRLLVRSAHPVQPHSFNPDRYRAIGQLAGEPVLLIDDTWTTGANAQSAAAAIKRAGAGPVAAVVIGRHLNRRWGSNDTQLNRLSKPFDWDRCVRCKHPDVT
jgi:predicted phosphoribosyltransferase